MKCTPDWGYHFEAEMEAESNDDAKIKKTLLNDTCQELRITPMTPEQIRKKIDDINKSHGFT
ncbi:hypothetical protein COY23_01400 [bacterium (Candidatus Torokbacteria) CG_4_10_14_0_2_um_filter_35_8]|nr:MAG: hypothetical protein COY23_01400 [bacterium (Candidatus Torokbacteria) CG_4_10_14_0_2_um_filter_35_8]